MYTSNDHNDQSTIHHQDHNNNNKSTIMSTTEHTTKHPSLMLYQGKITAHERRGIDADAVLEDAIAFLHEKRNMKTTVPSGRTNRNSRIVHVSRTAF